MNNEEIKEIKIGMYTTDEILKFMTDGEGRGFMGRSMYDAIFDYITNLQEQLHQASLDIQELTEKDIGCPSWCDKLTNLQEENEKNKIYSEFYKDMSNKWKDLLDVFKKDYYDYKSRNEKANTLLDKLLESAYIDGEYIMYDYSTSELLEVKQALQGEDYNKVERAYLDDEWIGEDKE